MLDQSDITVKRACKLVNLSRTGCYRPPQETVLDQAIRSRLRELAHERPAFGSPRLTILLQREFGVINHKKVERLYADEGLQLPRRPKQRRRGVSRILEALRQTDRLPGTIVCDNGPEFTSKAMLKWSMDKGIKLNFIEPVKPTANAYIESFNGKLRQECLRQHWFESLNEARDIVEAWRQDYNHVRPHSSLEYGTPKEVVRQHQMMKNLSLTSHWACAR